MITGKNVSCILLKKLSFKVKKGRITTLPEAGRVRFEPAGVSHGSARWKLATVAAKGHSSLGQSP